MLWHYLQLRLAQVILYVITELVLYQHMIILQPGRTVTYHIVVLAHTSLTARFMRGNYNKDQRGVMI